MLMQKTIGASASPPPEFVSASTNRVASSASITVTAPSGIQDGDLLVGIFYASAASTSNLPSGFTLAYNDDTANNPRVRLGWKIASSESGNYTFTPASSTNLVAAVLLYRYASFDTDGTITRASSTATVTASAIDPVSSGILIASFTIGVSAAPSVTTGPTGMTARIITTGTVSAPALYIYDQVITSDASTGTRSITFNTSGSPSGLLFSVS